MRHPAWALSIAACLLAAAPAASSAEAAQGPTREQVRTAVEHLKADPNMPGTKTEKQLRFKERKEKEEKPQKRSDLGWLSDFIAAIADGARWLVWGLGALAVAWLLLRIHRWMQVNAGAVRPGRGPLPSHVGSLDIRPESLPEDIGNGAAGLWQRGQHRPALSLLYRGALSRLVHLHAVPVRAASTEGECVALAQGRLSPEAHAFFVRLVEAWQLAAYGGRLPATAQVLAICNEFDQHLSVAPAPGSAGAAMPAAGGAAA